MSRLLQLLKPLMNYLTVVVQDYKDDVNGMKRSVMLLSNAHKHLCLIGHDYADVLAADPQLAREVEFDLRKFNEESRAAQQQLLQRQSLASVSSPISLGPSVCG